MKRGRKLGIIIPIRGEEYHKNTENKNGEMRIMLKGYARCLGHL